MVKDDVSVLKSLMFVILPSLTSLSDMLLAVSSVTTLFSSVCLALTRISFILSIIVSFSMDVPVSLFLRKSETALYWLSE